MRIVQFVQRRALVEHPRAGRRVEQLGGRYPHTDRTGAHHPAGRALLGIHHRRGAHALGGGVQRLPQNARRAARTRDLHPRDDRKTQDHPDHPLAVPNLRFQPHPRRGRRRIPQIHRLAGRHRGRRRVAQPHRPESRRGYARRPVDVRQGRVVLRQGARLPQRRPDAQRPGLRHLLRRHGDAARGQLCRHAGDVRQRAVAGFLGADLHGGAEPPHARPADGQAPRNAAADRNDRDAARTIPDAGGRLQCRVPVRSHLLPDGARREDPAIVQPAVARRAGPDEDRRARPKKK